MEFETATLAELGRFIASRTADTEAAAIARSSAPQLRYDAVVTAMLRDPQRRDLFTVDEWRGLLARITDEARRLGAWHTWGLLYGKKPGLDDLEAWDADGGCEAVDGCWIEADGHCPHGCPSWMLVMGMI